MFALKGNVGGHWPFIESVALDSDVGERHEVRVGDDGGLYIRENKGGESVRVDMLTLLKAISLAFPNTFREVSEARTPAYGTLANEFYGRLNTLTNMAEICGV